MFLLFVLVLGVPNTVQLIQGGLVGINAQTAGKHEKEFTELRIKIDNLVIATSKLTDVMQQTTLTTALNVERIQQINRDLTEIKKRLNK